MDFSRNNPVVNLCLQAMGLEDLGQPEDALKLFLQAWHEATNEHEKFLAAYYVARTQENIPDKLEWLQISLQFALKINDDSVNSAFPGLYANIAQCYEELNEPDEAKANYELAASFQHTPSDQGPFYHGTRADLQMGDLLTAGGHSNYQSDLVMNHIYFTALPNGAGLAAALAQGDGPERVYIVEPTGDFENDPNVTDKKFPGNPTRSYRSEAPLKIVGEIDDWQRQTAEELQQWRKRLTNIKGEILN